MTLLIFGVISKIVVVIRDYNLEVCQMHVKTYEKYIFLPIPSYTIDGLSFCSMWLCP